MDLRSLQVFLAVHGHLSFTRTASEMHMSVSAVSRTIQRLEEELDCSLFERDRRSMRATAAAEQLRVVAEQMIASWRELQLSLSGGAAVRGKLRVFCSVTATHQLLSPLLAAYRQAYDGVEVILQTGDQADGVEQVRSGGADVAMIARPEDLHDSLSFLALTESPLMLCLPAVDCAISQRLGGLRGARFWTGLRREPWILPERGVSREMIERWLFSDAQQLPPVYARVAGHEAIAAMVALGLGVGVVPELVVAASGAAEALNLRPVPALPVMSIGLCARKSRLAEPVVAALWDVAADQIA